MNIIHKLHNTTAKICEDIAERAPEELKEPQPIRRFTRLAAIAAAAGLLVAAIVVMASRIPKLQSEKKLISSDSTVQDVNTTLSQAVTTGHSINCPCTSQALSWCTVTTFHIIKYNQSISKLKVFNLTKDEGATYIDQICAPSPKFKDRQEICDQILSPIINWKDSRTNLPTASAFTTPELLYNEIAIRIDTNAYEQGSVHSYLGVINETENLNFTEGMIDLIRTMQAQFLKSNFSASLEDYWEASGQVRANHSLSFCFGMDVSWETYLQTCKPAFCDVEYEISVLSRVLRVMGQVGGITTIITLALKFLIWPSLRFALRFPTSLHESPVSNIAGN